MCHGMRSRNHRRHQINDRSRLDLSAIRVPWRTLWIVVILVTIAVVTADQVLRCYNHRHRPDLACRFEWVIIRTMRFQCHAEVPAALPVPEIIVTVIIRVEYHHRHPSLPLQINHHHVIIMLTKTRTTPAVNMSIGPGHKTLVDIPYRWRFTMTTVGYPQVSLQVQNRRFSTMTILTIGPWILPRPRRIRRFTRTRISLWVPKWQSNKRS